MHIPSEGRHTMLGAIAPQAPVASTPDSPPQTTSRDPEPHIPHTMPTTADTSDMCKKCGVEMVIMSNESMLGCTECGVVKLYIQATASRIVYGEEVEFSSFSYKRLNHFLDSLAAFQAKESTVVKEDVLQQVMAELHARRVTNTASITVQLVKDILYELKLPKRHATQITTRITGRMPKRMSQFQKEQVIMMFLSIQAPFKTHCPPERRNFLSYSYCLYKFCELMGWDSFLPCFTLLKGRDKLLNQDIIFEKICADLGWEFISSFKDNAAHPSYKWKDNFDGVSSKNKNATKHTPNPAVWKNMWDKVKPAKNEIITAVIE